MKLINFLFLILLFSSVFVVSKAQEDNEEDERRTEVDLSGSKVQVESRSTISGVENEFTVEIEAKNTEVEAELRFKRHSNGTETDFKYKVKFLSVFEYQESGSASSGYNDGVDTKGTEYLLGEDTTSYTAQLLSPQPNPNNNMFNILRFSVSSDDSIFSLAGKVSDYLYSEVGVGEITPNQVKVDFNLGFGSTPETQYTQSTPRLAIKAKVKTETEINDIEQTVSAPIDRIAVGINSQGSFSWVNNATCNGTLTTNVIATSAAVTQEPGDDNPSELENSRIVYFAFDCVRPSSISWDPQIGVNTKIGAAFKTSISYISVAVAVFVSVLQIFRY